MDKITLTKKQFERWWAKYIPARAEPRYWNELVEESQKRERIEAWAVDWGNGDHFVFRGRQEAEECVKANKRVGNPAGRIVRLVEAQSEE